MRKIQSNAHDAQAVVEAPEFWWCEMMQRLVSVEAMIDGKCYWDEDECEGWWVLLVKSARLGAR